MLIEVQVFISIDLQLNNYLLYIFMAKHKIKKQHTEGGLGGDSRTKDT